MSTEELHTEFHRRSSGLWGARRFVWLGVPSPRRAAHQRSELRSGARGGLANSLGLCHRMADPAAMSDPRQARPKRDASVRGDDATYYVEEHESGWRASYNDAPIGIFKDAGDASRFVCDLARIQAQIGRVTWVIVLAEVEEAHRFETRAGSIEPPIEQGVHSARIVE